MTYDHGAQRSSELEDVWVSLGTEEIVDAEIEELHSSHSTSDSSVLLDQTCHTTSSDSAQGVHPLGSHGYLGYTRIQTLLSQSRLPHKIEAEKKQRMVFGLQNAGALSEIQDVQNAVCRERHGNVQGFEVMELARCVTLMRNSSCSYSNSQKFKNSNLNLNY